MTAGQKYQKMVYYLEACESGSMFTSLAKNTKIYALSASSPTESSWGCYCPPQDQVGGKHINSCLGDLFSVNWMEDDDVADVTTETLQQQFTTVHQKTVSYSNVMQWGDLSFTSDVVGAFIGMKKSGAFKQMLDFFGGMKQMQTLNVDQRDAQLQFLMRNFQQNPTQENLLALEEEIAITKTFNKVFEVVKSEFKLTGLTAVDTDWDCYK